MPWKAELIVRWAYLTDSWKEFAKHRLCGFMIFVVGAYAAFIEWIVPHVKMPNVLEVNLPKLPLIWAFVIILAILFLVVWEGGYRRLKAENQLKEKAENKSKELEGEQQKLLGDVAAKWEALENASKHVERLEREIAELRSIPPRIEVVRCERAFKHLYEGLVVRNHGGPAFNIEISSVHVGSAILTRIRGVESLAKDDGERHVQFEIQNKSGQMGSENLFDLMRTQSIDAIDVLITYKDWDNHWYRTLCKIERDVLAKGGLVFRHGSQERTKAPA